MQPSDRPVAMILGFLCNLATLVIFAACLYLKVAWGPLYEFGFVGVLITALGVTLVAYLVTGLAVAAAMMVEDKVQARKMDKLVDRAMDRFEAEMRSRRDRAAPSAEGANPDATDEPKMPGWPGRRLAPGRPVRVPSRLTSSTGRSPT